MLPSPDQMPVVVRSVARPPVEGARCQRDLRLPKKSSDEAAAEPAAAATGKGVSDAAILVVRGATSYRSRSARVATWAPARESQSMRRAIRRGPRRIPVTVFGLEESLIVECPKILLALRRVLELQMLSFLLPSWTTEGGKASRSVVCCRLAAKSARKGRCCRCATSDDRMRCC